MAAVASSAGQRSKRLRIREPASTGASATKNAAAGRTRATTNTSATPHAAMSHAKARGVVAEGRRSDERRQGARWVLDREVAIRNAAVVQDRVSVVPVRRPVDELAVRPEPAMDEPEAGEEQAACGERLS